MTKSEHILEQAILTQVGLEEEIYCEVTQHLRCSEMGDFPEVKNALTELKLVLEVNFQSLNSELDKIYRTQKLLQITRTLENDSLEPRTDSPKLSMTDILNYFYSSLTWAAINNTWLHKSALALNAGAVADMATEHLTKLREYSTKLENLKPSAAI